MKQSMRLLATLCCCALSSCWPQADEAPRSTPRKYGYSIFDLLRVRQLKLATKARVVHSERASTACRDAYARLLNDGVLEIRIAFGYKDARPARFVGDGFERVALIQHLTRPCLRGYNACGFERDPEDADVLTRKFTGPDDKEKLARVVITQSSVGSDDESNRQNPFQAWQSSYAERNFLSGLQSADAVFYIGHSRAGGGPDFFPPKLEPSKHPDYTWYERAKPGLAKTVKALKSAARPTPLLGIYSCISSLHFSEEITKVSPDTALVASTVLLYYSDAMSSSLGTLNALIGGWCQDAFREGIRLDGGRVGSRLRGFFTSASSEPQAQSAKE